MITRSCDSTVRLYINSVPVPQTLRRLCKWLVTRYCVLSRTILERHAIMQCYAPFSSEQPFALRQSEFINGEVSFIESFGRKLFIIRASETHTDFVKCIKNVLCAGSFFKTVLYNLRSVLKRLINIAA